MQEMGPTAFRSYPRSLECLTACRYHSKGNTFSSVILRPWVWVRPGSWTPTSRTVVRRSSSWANQAAVIISIISKLRKYRYYAMVIVHENLYNYSGYNKHVRWTFMYEDLYVFLGHLCLTIKRNKLIDSSNKKRNKLREKITFFTLKSYLLQPV